MLSLMGRSIDGQVYIFTADSINWSNQTARGFNYVQTSPGKGYWVAAQYPLPDVVYDRVVSRRSESREKLKKTKARLRQNPKLSYFNPSFLNKWEVYQLLEGKPDLTPYLPETKLLNLFTLEEMLNKYRVVYAKPANGSLGFGIIRIRLGEKGALHYTTYGSYKRRSQAKNADEFLKKTRDFRKKHSYIVQQGLDLATYRGSSFDLRIIYQKNSQGEWQISKKFARVAPMGSWVANLARGGTVITSRIVLKNIFKKQEKINKTNKQIRLLCQQIAGTLEKSSGETYGEMGLDLGIDKNGHPWLIEVNSKPRKTTETNYSQTIMKNVFLRPLKYAIYLAGFGKTR
jgi:glutathione synthase/RimK-type ligase-like ATP-grasp enzyme